MSGSKRQNADNARTAYVQHLGEKGIRLTRAYDTREVIYKTASDKTVRIPFANEKTAGDAWWWGLPDAIEFEFVILLCKTHSGEQLDFVLPAAFLLPIWSSLSPDKQGGVNFDVIRRSGSDYRLVLRGGRLRPIDGFLGQIEALAS